MSIAGIFTNSRPEFKFAGGGMFFDATIEESTELTTDVTEYPIETGATGNDHAVNRPLALTMRVGISDNFFRALKAKASSIAPGAGEGVAIPATQAAGAGIGALGGKAAAAAGIAGSVSSAAFQAGQEKVRSQAALDLIRLVQRSNTLIDVVTLKEEYKNCLITSTRQTTNKENEQALELEIGLTQLITVPLEKKEDKEKPAENDPVASAAQPSTDLGEL